MVLLRTQDMWRLLAFFLVIVDVDASSLSLDPPDQLVAWIDGKEELLGSCRREMEEKISDDRVALLEVADCNQIENPSGNIPHGRFDSSGRLEGKVKAASVILDKTSSGRISDYLDQRFGQRGRKA